jgi:hypothetical protein
MGRPIEFELVKDVPDGVVPFALPKRKASCCGLSLASDCISAKNVCPRGASRGEGSDLVWLIDIRALEKTNSIGSTSFQAISYILAEREIVEHNATCFDLAWCWAHLQIRVKNVKDTMAAHRLLLGGLNSSDAPANLGSVSSSQAIERSSLTSSASCFLKTSCRWKTS